MRSGYLLKRKIYSLLCSNFYNIALKTSILRIEFEQFLAGINDPCDSGKNALSSTGGLLIVD